jgi:hypothetical protein
MTAGPGNQYPLRLFELARLFVGFDYGALENLWLGFRCAQLAKGETGD